MQSNLLERRDLLYIHPYFPLAYTITIKRRHSNVIPLSCYRRRLYITRRCYKRHAYQVIDTLIIKHLTKAYTYDRQSTT